MKNILWASALAALLSGVATAQAPPPVTTSASEKTELEAATLENARLLDLLREAKLEAGACGGQLRVLFADTYGADSKQRFATWVAAYERAHPGWTYDLDRNIAVPKAKPKEKP